MAYAYSFYGFFIKKNINKKGIKMLELKDIKKNDTIVFYDKKEVKVNQDNNRLYYSEYGNNIYLDTLDLDTILEIKKYAPKIYFDGASAVVISYVLDDSKNLIFLELGGNETSIKSITSVLMQGRIKMNKFRVVSEFIGLFSVLKKGNKRKLVTTNSICSSILFNRENENILFSKNKKGIIIKLKEWLNNQPLPFPFKVDKDFEDIFSEMLYDEKIIELKSRGDISAIQISDEVFDDNYQYLQKIILKIAYQNGYFNNKIVDSHPKIPLDFKYPKSNILEDWRIKELYSKLEDNFVPLDGSNNEAKVILKMFMGSWTWYITEINQNYDECYGFVKSHLAEEWGYFSLKEVLSVGAEKDLYFKDKYINQNGEII